MANFVHLTNIDNVAGIRRNGVRPHIIHYENIEKGVFCMPVVQDFFATHQWARELKRFGMRIPVGIYFKIPDNEEVFFGKYNDIQSKCKASEAVSLFMAADDRMGYQAIIQRKIKTTEIYRVRKAPLVGWRYYPAAKKRKRCLCPACIGKGEYGIRKTVKRRYDQQMKQYRHAANTEERIGRLSELLETVEEHKLPYSEIIGLINQDVLENEEALEAALLNITSFMGQKKKITHIERLMPYIKRIDPTVQGEFAFMVMCSFGDRAKTLLEPIMHVPEVMEQINEYEALYEED